MRRLIGSALAAAGLLLAGLVGIGSGGDTGGYRVDAIFDNADFLISGQDVKVAGARAGSVTGVHLTPDGKARIEMSLDPGFAPFRANADCQIRPQSIIGEKFVQCDPGTASAAPLGRHGGRAPTVALGQTHSPVDLDLLFTALRLPIRERLSLVVGELGTGLAGRPAELNAAIRRANPALQQANRTLRILSSERRTLGRLIDGSDRVLGELAARRAQVTDFVDHADAVASTVASRRGNLDLAVHRLPPLLAQLEPSAVELTGAATDARPIVRDLAAAAPQLRALLSDFQPLADATRPTLVKLAELSRTGRHALRATLPVARLLDPVARRLQPTVRIAKRLVDSLRVRGVPEELGYFVWIATAAIDRFDQVSHIFPSYQISGTCQQYVETPTAGCSAHFAASGIPDGAKASRRSRKQGKAGAATPLGAPGRSPRSPAAGGRGGSIAQRAADAARRHGSPNGIGPTSSQILDWLLSP